MKTDIASLRQEYALASLDEKDVFKNPFDQFKKWFDEAVSSEETEPNAMILATVGRDNAPLQRTVLLKGFDAGSFTFFTNYASEKGRQIAENPTVSLLFPWINLQRQLIIQGTASKIPREESLAYFRSRPRGSQLGALVSNQSEKISSREVLEEKLAIAEKDFENQEVPLPDHWGGYVVKPSFFEFWQGRQSRLHDRICFELDGNEWKISRRSP
ncbi:MAG: pyridoxamine 5'-phosphate oxidase [Bacteroidota bacterium]